jgi:hypothetical protein
MVVPRFRSRSLMATIPTITSRPHRAPNHARSFNNVTLQSAGYFMPGAPVDNTQMDAYIAPLNRMSQRIKRRILAENGILQRHYAIDAEGNTVFNNAQMAASAIRDCLLRGKADLSAVSLLATGSSGGDTLMPGFANMVQGELAAPPMETVSVHGICAAGVSAIQAAAQGIELGAHRNALAVASEMPSRCSSDRALLRLATRPISTRISCAGCCPMAPARCCCRTVRRWPRHRASGCGSSGSTSARFRAITRCACSSA